MRHSLACLHKSRTSPPALLDHLCNLTGVCVLRFSCIKSRREAKNMYEYHSKTHQQTRTYVRAHHVMCWYVNIFCCNIYRAYFNTGVKNYFRHISASWCACVEPCGLFLEARGDILRYTDIGRRAFPYTSPPYGPGKPQPIDGCWGVGRPALAVLSYCCAGIPLCPVIE